MEYTAIKLTEEFEGLQLTAYKDSVGVWTIGYGHTLNVTEGMTITQEQAEQFLEEDIQISVNTVNALVKVVITQDEFNALVDFVFNLGAHALQESTLLKLLNESNFIAASAEFVKWDQAGGKVLSGLLKRREAEQNEFNE